MYDSSPYVECKNRILLIPDLIEPSVPLNGTAVTKFHVKDGGITEVKDVD